jgi:hypothetical protein
MDRGKLRSLSSLSIGVDSMIATLALKAAMVLMKVLDEFGALHAGVG